MNGTSKRYNSIRLTKFPSEIEFPESLRSKVYYDATALKLIFMGRMTERERDILLSLSNKKSYKGAVRTLFLRSNSVSSKFEYWMKYRFVSENEQSVQALVYFGAAVLVIIVGLRGLGDLSDVTFIPAFMLNKFGKIETNIVMLGLLFEFSMLCLLAVVSFYSTSEKEDSLSEAISDLTELLRGIDNPVPKDITDAIVENVNKTARLSEALILEEKKILNNYNNKVEILISEGHRALENLTKKYNQIIESENRILAGIADNHVKPQVYMQKKLEIESQILERLQNIEREHKRLIHTGFNENNSKGFFKKIFG